MHNIDARVVDRVAANTLRPRLTSTFDLPGARLAWGVTDEFGPVVLVETNDTPAIVFQVEGR